MADNTLSIREIVEKNISITFQIISADINGLSQKFASCCLIFIILKINKSNIVYKTLRFLILRSKVFLMLLTDNSV